MSTVKLPLPELSTANVPVPSAVTFRNVPVPPAVMLPVVVTLPPRALTQKCPSAAERSPLTETNINPPATLRVPSVAMLPLASTANEPSAALSVPSVEMLPSASIAQSDTAKLFAIIAPLVP